MKSALKQSRIFAVSLTSASLAEFAVFLSLAALRVYRLTDLAT
ncbi:MULTISPECIES: hypothetical protein [unclassified Lentimonas]|nr:MULTISPECIES: hypothetical protein [unclassified Lentimonas]